MAAQWPPLQGETNILSVQFEINELETLEEHYSSKLVDVGLMLQQKRLQFIRLKNLCARVASLPNETLSMIFEAGCSLSLSHDDEYPFEILASQVTHHWRNVAITTPSIWTKIRMTRGTLSELGALSAYLLRSTTLPLDLEFHIPAFSDTTIPYITTACQMLAPHSVRFSRLSVACETSECGFHFFECLAYVHVPILKHLEIMSASLSQTDEGVISPLKIFTQGTPSLRSARFRGIGLQNCLPHLSTITFLHIHCLFGDMQINYHELHCALQGFSALTRLILSGGDVLYDWSSAVPIIVLPVLQFLHIGTDPSSISTDISGVLLTISAPSLESLVLNDVWAKELKVFFRSTTSNPSQFLSLRSLTIGFVNDDWDPLIWADLSRAFPTIIRLSLSNQETESFVQFLQLSPADEINECKVYWPDLQMLAFLADSDADEVMICDIVSARIAFGRPLQRICLSESTMNEVRDQLEWLRERVEVEQAGNPTVSWDDSRLRAIEEDVMVLAY